MFTGMLANLTEGEALMEMMMTLNYDAFGIGNHEFDYGLNHLKEELIEFLFLSLEPIFSIRIAVNYLVGLSPS